MREQLVTRLLPVLAKKPQEEFNVFDVMRYGGHERQLSDVFAWLLDAGGTHKLGDAFQRVFIDEVNRGIRDAEPVAHGAYGVRQEVNTAEARAGGDIADLIVEDDKTVLVVENYYTSSGHGRVGTISPGRRLHRTSVRHLLGGDPQKSDGRAQAARARISASVQAPTEGPGHLPGPLGTGCLAAG